MIVVMHHSGKHCPTCHLNPRFTHSHMHRSTKERCWEAVSKSNAARILKLADIKACQEYFRDTFTRIKRKEAEKKPRSGSGAVCRPSPSWPLWNSMQFLNDSVAHRQTTGNLDLSPMSSCVDPTPVSLLQVIHPTSPASVAQLTEIQGCPDSREHCQ